MVEGFESSKAEVCVVMGADMSHPIDTLPQMIKLILDDEVDTTVGRREIRSVSSWSSVVPYLEKPWDGYYSASIWEQVSYPYWRGPRSGD